VNKELIINSSQSVAELALIEDNKLVEYHTQEGDNQYAVGDVYLGRVKKLMPWMNAAFVDIGHEKDAFIHYTDLGPTLNSVVKFTKKGLNKSIKHNEGLLDEFRIEKDIDKNGKINNVLSKNLHLLVQIQKEPISTKGHRLTCEITLPGRFIVLVPFSNVIAISKKITDANERERLTKLIESIKPKNFGVIVRTVARDKKVAELHREIEQLTTNWKKIYKELHKASPPKKLLSEMGKTNTLVRDLLSKDFNKIVVNDDTIFNDVQSYIERIAPERAKIVEQYKGKKPIFDQYGVTRQIKSSFGKTSTVRSGTYIVIEHTEAMHVIDVNSGHKKNSSSQEESSLAVNLEAAKEVARQLRLRDIGGIIIVDFIDMRNADNRKKLQRSMKEFMENDRAQHTILPLSKFGLMQITRQRVRPQIEINTTESCPTCKGTGKMEASILIQDEITEKIEQLVESSAHKKIQVTAHPFVEAFLKQKLYKLQRQWFMKSGKWIKIHKNENYPISKFTIVDENEEEIIL